MWDFTEANWVSEVKGSGVMKVVFVFVGGRRVWALWEGGRRVCGGGPWRWLCGLVVVVKWLGGLL